MPPDRRSRTRLVVLQARPSSHVGRSGTVRPCRRREVSRFSASTGCPRSPPVTTSPPRSSMRRPSVVHRSPIATSSSSRRRSCRRPRVARSNSTMSNRRRSRVSGLPGGTRIRGWSRWCCANRSASSARSVRCSSPRPITGSAAPTRESTSPRAALMVGYSCCRRIPMRRRAAFVPGSPSSAWTSPS